MSVTQYTQTDLWMMEGVTLPREQNRRTDEEMPIQWIHSIARSQRVNCAHYNLICDTYAPGFDPLNDWLENKRMKPAGCLLYINIPNDGNRLPALWTETESHNDICSSVNKTACGVITQLRCLRCYSDQIVKCQGFMFPTTEQARVVVMVTVTWHKLALKVELNYLELHNVKEHVIGAVKLMDQNCALLYGTERGNYFIRLSPRDLDLLVSDAEDRQSAEQICSKHNILVGTANYVYKIVPNYSDYETLSTFYLLQKDGKTANRESVVL